MENKYEVIELILKKRDDGSSWFDILFDYIDGCEDCEMESMSGSVGTLEQCYNWSTTVGMNLQPIDLAHAINELHAGLMDEKILKVLEWAKEEVEFYEWL